MKFAIYSRGLDIEQENPLLILLEELAKISLLEETLLEETSRKNGIRIILIVTKTWPRLFLLSVKKQLL